MNFYQKHVHSNVLKVSVALEEFSITLQFLGLKMQKQLFEEIKHFAFRIEVQVITKPSS